MFVQGEEPKTKKRKIETAEKNKGKTIDDFFGKNKEDKEAEEVNDEDQDSDVDTGETDNRQDGKNITSLLS